jgi:bifunctional non-homologous end joining protein LigD
VFDVLLAAREDLRHRALVERKLWLQRNVTRRPDLRVIDYVSSHGEELFGVIARQDFEGIVAKRLDAPYRADRQSAWRKIKNAGYSWQEGIRFGARRFVRRR